MEHWPSHDDTIWCEDTALKCDGVCCEDVVPSTHLDDDTSLVTVCDCLANAGVERIFNANNPNEDHVTSKLFEGNLVDGQRYYRSLL